MNSFIGSTFSPISKVNISLTLADGAIYPNAIKIIENGEVKNPFDGL